MHPSSPRPVVLAAAVAAGVLVVPARASAQSTDAAFDSALDRALSQSRPTEAPPSAAGATAAGRAAAGSSAAPDLLGAPLRLIDLSLDALVNAGSSTEQDDSIGELQGGGHDPKQRGFTLSQLELSAVGAVDPFFQFESHLVYLLTPDGESEFELEEAFARSNSLPGGLQLKVGQYFTEFGRINSQHPHAWDFIDQPVISSRVFGADGMRGPGARLAWLVPVPWFAELCAGVQSARGETMASFRGTDEESAPGGHAVEETTTRSLADFAWSSRLLQSFDLTDDLVSQFGLSGAWGPSAAGSSTRAAVYGADLKLKWVPARNDAGWPFVSFQAEALRRIYGTDLQLIDPDGVPASGDEATVPGDTLRDRGGYAYLLWGFRRDWVAGLRWEVARSTGAGLDPRSDDPFRDDRQRFSPTLAWHPTHFSRVRLQYNLDFADHLAHHDAHSVWLGLEFVIGSHPAHAY